jgi:hypothetical protein
MPAGQAGLVSEDNGLPDASGRRAVDRPAMKAETIGGDEAAAFVPGDVPVCDGDPRCAMDQRADQVVALVILQE